MVVHVIRLNLLSSPNFNWSLHPTMFCEMTIMIEIVTLNKKPTSISYGRDFFMMSAMDGFVTIVIALVIVSIEHHRVSLRK